MLRKKRGFVLLSFLECSLGAGVSVEAPHACAVGLGARIGNRHTGVSVLGCAGRSFRRRRLRAQGIAQLLAALVVDMARKPWMEDSFTYTLICMGFLEFRGSP